MEPTAETSSCSTTATVRMKTLHQSPRTVMACIATLHTTPTSSSSLFVSRYHRLRTMIQLNLSLLTCCSNVYVLWEHCENKMRGRQSKDTVHAQPDNAQLPRYIKQKGGNTWLARHKLGHELVSAELWIIVLRAQLALFSQGYRIVPYGASQSFYHYYPTSDSSCTKCNIYYLQIQYRISILSFVVVLTLQYNT